jgi:transposase
MRGLSDFKRGRVVGAHLAGASTAKMAISLSVSRAAVAKVVMAHTNHGKTSSTKGNSGQNPKLSERHHHTLKRIVCKNHRTTVAKVTAELSIHLVDPVSTKKVQELHKSNIHGRAAIAKPLIPENNNKK